MVCDFLRLHGVGRRQDNPCFDVFVPAPTVLTTFGRQKTRKTQKCETEKAGGQPVHRCAGDRGRGGQLLSRNFGMPVPFSARMRNLY